MNNIDPHNIVHLMRSNYNVHITMIYIYKIIYKVRVKSSTAKEPPSGESTTAECRVNYQLLAVIY